MGEEGEGGRKTAKSNPPAPLSHDGEREEPTHMGPSQHSVPSPPNTYTTPHHPSTKHTVRRSRGLRQPHVWDMVDGWMGGGKAGHPVQQAGRVEHGVRFAIMVHDPGGEVEKGEKVMGGS